MSTSERGEGAGGGRDNHSGSLWSRAARAGLFYTWWPDTTWRERTSATGPSWFALLFSPRVLRSGELAQRFKWLLLVFMAASGAQ